MVDYIFFRLQITIKKNFLYAPGFERIIYDNFLIKIVIFNVYFLCHFKYFTN